MQNITGQRVFGIVVASLLAFYTSGSTSVEKAPLTRASFSGARATGQSPQTHGASRRGAKALLMASWYGEEFQGRQTASGELFDLNQLTAAHRTLPLGSRVRLRALATGRSVVVRINDRGPWLKGRDFDLSEAAAIALGIHDKGIAAVEVAVLGRGPRQP
jgi:rare lipoprotein A